MVHRSVHRSKRRARFVFGSLLAGLVLALSIGSFAPAALAGDSPEPGGPSAATVELPSSDPNPALNPACGLNIVLVVDRSSSTHDFDQDYRDAAKAFVDGLVGTPSHIGIVTFGTLASVASAYQDVASGPGTLDTVIDSLPNVPPEFPTPQYTNWQQALLTAGTFTDADLVVFITDGNPTAYGNPATIDLFGNTPLSQGITQANTLKALGVGPHITGVAVGKDIDLGNIDAIVGAGAGLGGANPDVHESDTSTLVDDVKALAVDLCGGTVTIHKQVRTGSNSIDSTNPALVDGWAFSNGDAVSGTTGDDGTGLVNLKFDSDQLGANTLTESAGLAGYSIESVTCNNEPMDHSSTSFGLTVGKEDIINCTVVNARPRGSTTVETPKVSPEVVQQPVIVIQPATPQAAVAVAPAAAVLAAAQFTG